MENLAKIESFNEKLLESNLISSLKDNMHDERRISFNSVTEKRTLSEISVIRLQTDQALRALQDLKTSDIDGFESYTDIDKLDSIRKLVDSNQLEPLQVLDVYSGILSRINSLVTFSTENIRKFDSLHGDVQAYRILSRLITQLGNARSDYYYALNKRLNDSNSIDRVNNSYSLFLSLQDEFLMKSSLSQSAKYRKLLDSGRFKLINSTLKSYLNGSLAESVSDQEWWDVSLDGVKELQNFRKEMYEDIYRDSKEIYQDELRSKNFNLAFLIGIILLVMLIVIVTIRSITKSLNELREVALNISSGKNGRQINYYAKDVISELAGSIYRIDENAQSLAAAADQIGKGNFAAEIVPRDKEDDLGNAILKMRDDLKLFNEENEIKFWNQEGLSLISTSVVGERNVHDLSHSLLDAMHDFFEHEVSTLYVSDEHQQNLYLRAVHGASNPELIPEHLKVGQNQLGKAAEKNQVKQLTDLPADYLKMSSSLGETVPRHIVFVPLYYNNHLEGIIEMASVDAFSQNEIQLLQTMSENIAIALQASKSREKLQELLEETQSQSEELQTQQSELEGMNAELEAQALSLQSSEEELRVQQEELQQTNLELENRTQLLTEKNEEIIRKAEELAISTKYKSEFLANMSHELRTPLNSILLLSRLLSEDHSNNLTTEQIEFARVIQNSGNGLLHLIDEILDLSKIEAGKMDLEIEEVIVSDVLDEMDSMFRLVAREKGLKFEIVPEDDTYKIETDRMRLGQVLKNLISNALKFTSEGSVILTAEVCKLNTSFYCFKVSDTGIGISEDKQKLIFEAFQQADGSTKRKYGGTGLGLSISKELVKLLGGEISLSSEPEKGSEFTIYIPIKQSNKKDLNLPKSKYEPVKEDSKILENPLYEQYLSEETPQYIPDDRKKLREEDKVILIVEDDVNFAKSLLEFARQRGYKGVVCVRGDEAETMAKLYKPTGILLDIELPVMNGWQVMDNLKANPAIRHIPVHMMSSHPMKRQSLQKGAIDFIEKPQAYDKMGDIFEKIEKVLQKSPKKILIIEDNPQHADALSFFLKTFDVNAEVKNDLNEGLSALKDSSLDCVVLDMGIPDHNAYKVLEEAKKSNEFANLPIIVFTGKSLSEGEEQKIRKYADTIVVKTAHSYQRMLDEVSLFLHIVEDGSTSEGKQTSHRQSFTEVLEGKTVLIADDDVRNIFSLTKNLEAYNMKVITATDGKEAMDKLNEHPETDIVLLDMMMPKMDGYETAQAIRKDSKHSKIPIIAVTAKAMTGDRDKCVQAGASDYITKPVDIDQLLSLLRVWLYNK